MSQDESAKSLGAAAPARPEGERVSQVTGLKLAEVRPPAESLAGPLSTEEAPASKVDPLVGCTIDNRYKIESILGEGGMGVVYRVRHKIIDKKAAMKVLRADLARDQEVTERFLIEAKAASAIGHEHIIDISDFGLLPDGSTYFVMEYLDGKPLASLVEDRTPVPVPRIVKIALQLAEGLAAAHEAGIVHRDLKPDNIYLISRGSEKDFVKILDFGIAKVSTTSKGQLTRAGTVFGTPHYMSPEQAAGAPVDHRGDIYSFGVILYELACGKVPFDADNFMGILTQHMYKAPVPIRALVPPPADVPPGLEALILKCLSKRPEQRYQSMRELSDDLLKLRDGLVPDAVAEMMARSGGFNVPADFWKSGGRMPAPVPASPEAPGGRRRKWPLIAGAAGVAVAIGLVIAIFANSSVSPASSGPALPKAAVPVPAPPVALPAQAAKTTSVAIGADPMDAEVFRDGTSLGTVPVVVEVTEGQTVTVEVRRTGYMTSTLELDGKETRASVKLEPDKAVAPARTTRPAARAPRTAPESGGAKKGGSLGGGEIVNPWGH